jgi:ABC-2 type transport system ATP-binding protein
MSDLERVALDVAFMKSGKIVIQEPLDDLLDKVRRITGPVSALSGMQFKGEISRSRDAAGLATIVALVESKEAEYVESRRNAGVRADGISLEDLFIEVTQ